MKNSLASFGESSEGNTNSARHDAATTVPFAMTTLNLSSFINFTDHQNFSSHSATSLFSDDDLAISMEPADLALRIVKGLILTCIIFLVIFGNLLVIAAIAMNRRLRSTGVTYFFVISLAVADLLLAIIVLPINMVTIVVFNNRWAFGPTICNLVLCFDVTLCTASILNLFLTTCERYIAIVTPFRYSRIVTRKTVTLSIVLVWLISAFCSFVPLHLGWNTWDGQVQNQRPDDNPNECRFEHNLAYNTTLSITTFFIPLALLALANVRILRIAHSQRANINRQKSISENIKRSCSTLNNQGLLQGPQTPQRHAQSMYAGKYYNRKSVTNPKSHGGTSIILHKASTSPTSTLLEEEKTAGEPLLESNGKANGEAQNPHESTCVRPSDSVFSDESGTPATTPQPAAIPTSLSQNGIYKPNPTPGRVKQGFSFTNGARSQAMAVRSASIISSNDQAAVASVSVAVAIKQFTAENKATITILTIVGFFVACWLPYFVLFLAKPFLNQDSWMDFNQRYPNFELCLVWLGYVNSLCNPIIYTCLNRHFRVAFAKLLRLGKHSKRGAAAQSQITSNALPTSTSF